MSFLSGLTSNLGLGSVFGNTSPLDFLQSTQNNIFGTANNVISGVSNTTSGLFDTVGNGISSITDVFSSLINFIPFIMIGVGAYLLLTMLKK